ncbi:SusC/RagA family TonB-linked outer membrane protein [Larkinella arboricola]|nr:TonB-dependent receptor [Larkinella arboricola]
MKNLLPTRFKAGLLVMAFCVAETPGWSQTLAMTRQVARKAKTAIAPETRPLKDVLREIKSRYNVDILLEGGLIDGIRVAAEVVDFNQSVERNLTKILRPNQLHYKKIKAGSYLILDEKKGPKSTDDQPLTYIHSEGFGNQLPGEKSAEDSALPSGRGAETVADVTVRGKVTDDEKGSGLPGVSVVLKGTQRGATTDPDGNFSIVVPDGKAVLVFSFVGYEAQEVTVGNRTSINISLKADTKSLNEVVVVGYGTQKKANLTGAVSTVGGEVLESRPLVNLAQGLQGLVPNLNININSGAPGRGATYNVRGTTSINGGGPLVLVDGVQMDPNLINPADVASVTVLKDAASAAVYGVRGAYGVILITTKTPKKNAPLRVNYSGSITTTRPTRLPKYVNSVQYIRMHREADATGASSGGSQATEKFTELDLANAEKYLADPANNLPVYVDPGNPSKYRYVGNTDWIAEQYPGWAPMTDHNLSLSGGEGRTSFVASLGYLGQKGILDVANETFRRYNANLKVSTEVTKWMDLNFRFNLNRTEGNRPTPANTGGTAESWISNDLRPIMPVYHPDGNFSGQGSFTNPIALATLNGRSLDKANDLWLTGAIVLRPIEGLRVEANYTWNGYNRNIERHWKEYNEYGANGVLLGTFPWSRPSRVTEAYNTDTYTALNAYAEYQRTFGTKHNIKALVGYNQELKQMKFDSSSIKNLIDQTIPAPNLNNDPAPGIGASRGEWAVSGTFFRLNYDYAGKYLLELNGRYDGTSRFPRGNRYVFLPSISAGWRISEEPFFKPLQNVVNDLKFRGSYGTLGNQAGDVLGNYPYLATMSAGLVNYIFGGQRGGGVGTPGLISANFTWEKVTTMDLGVDFSLFNNRLITNFDWYIRDTKDMIVGASPLPAVLGTSAPRQNAANLRTKGWELSTTWRDRINKDWTYEVTLALSDYTARITKYDLNTTNSITNLGNGNYYNGQRLNEIWGFETAGFFATDDAAAQVDQKQIWGGTWLAGDIQYKDQNGDGKITRGVNTLSDPGDQKVIGNSTPRYQFGLNLSTQYRNFDFTMLVQGIGKRDLALSGRQFWGFTSEWDVPLQPILDYWTPENTGAYYPRMRFGGGGNFQPQTKYLQNGAYARLKNISLGYTLPRALTNKIKLQTVRVYVTGQNLFEVTKFYKALDPETFSQGAYPLNRALSGGIQIGL